tara:strand:- start:6609 stop:8288 length:1680 start_codon:yes stop_codon:yes gene_type:complete
VSDTNTKTLIKRLRHKVKGDIGALSAKKGLPLLASRARTDTRKYHPARLLLLITGVNLIPLVLLIFALLFLGEYRASLIESELELAELQGQYARSVVENKYLTNPDDVGSALNELNRNMARAPLWVMIFDAQSGLISNSLPADIKAQPKSEEGILNALAFSALNSFYELLSVSYNLPPFPINKIDMPQHLPGVQMALDGQSTIGAWSLNKNQLFFTTVVPVTVNNEAKGVVFLGRPASAIDETLTSLRNDIFRFFLIILFVSISVSLLLVNTIATPLRKLAKATESIRQGATSLSEIPDMSDRGDEIGELSLSLRALVQALWQRMDNIERFAADVAHELKNPIASMQSALEILPSIKAKKDKERLLSVLNQDVRRLDRLVTDISQASRLDVALSTEDVTALDLDNILENLVQKYAHRSEASEHAYTISMTNTALTPARIEGNAGRLEQVFTNVIDNAISFTPEGGTISIKLTERPTAYEIHISDEGSGISKGKEHQIFERFYSERDIEGNFGVNSGLGLSIAQQIIHAHTGLIQATNNLNGGACFTITLPKLNQSTKER